MEKTYPTNGRFSLTPLPYPTSALAPVISEETLNLHHGAHLHTYVANLNAGIAGTPWEGRPLEDIVCGSSGPLFNNAGQVMNHNLYFGQLRPPFADNAPHGHIERLIRHQYGSFEGFKSEFERTAATLFGAGWAWLSVDPDGRLKLTQEPNAGNPITRGLKPLLTADVWEHAYYVDYRNRRAEYLAALWSIVDWDVVEHRLTM